MTRQERYPRISRIYAATRCDRCRDQRSIVTVVIQTGWTRGDDKALHLCAGCYAASGAKPLPEKSREPSVHGREALLDVWREIQERKERT